MFRKKNWNFQNQIQWIVKSSETLIREIERETVREKEFFLKDKKVSASEREREYININLIKQTNKKMWLPAPAFSS